MRPPEAGLEVVEEVLTSRLSIRSLVSFLPEACDGDSQDGKGILRGDSSSPIVLGYRLTWAATANETASRCSITATIRARISGVVQR